MVPKIKVKCEICGKEIQRYQCEILKHIFCSRDCSKIYTSTRMKNINANLNPSRMREETKNKIRATHILYSGKKGYPKTNHKHTHRLIAAEKLGRKLKIGEIVHHKDGDKQNYSPDNLEVLKSQKEHANLHFKDGRFR